MKFNQEDELTIVKKLTSVGVNKSYSRGDLIYREGDQPKALFYIEKGLVGLTKLSSVGNESLLRVFKAGQFFGHRSLFAGEEYHGTAKCLEDCEVSFLDKEIVFGVFDDNPKAYFFLARALAKELRRAENRSVLVSEAHILERVASTLLLFKKLYPDHLWTRTEIANYCASRTPTVIKALAKMESMGIVKQDRRHIEIVDEAELLNLIDTEI